MANDNFLDRLAADIESAAFQNGVDQKLWELIARAGTALDVRIAASDSAWYLIRLPDETMCPIGMASRKWDFSTMDQIQSR